MFPHIKSTDSVVDRCTHALQKAILRGQLLPGDKLPPERDLATQFGVNRVTVRGALARLQVAGLVSVRQGSGYRVRDYRVHGGMDLIASVLSETEDSESLEGALGDLLTIRRSMAMALLNRLSRGILPEDLRNVSRAIDALDAVAASGAEPGALAEADGAILRALIEATRSPVLGLCINPILQLLASQPRLCRAIFSRPAESLVSWRLFEAWLADPTSLPVDQILHHLERQDRHTLARMRALS